MDIFDQLEMGVQIIDSDMRYVYLNKFLLKSLPFSLEEHVGKKMKEVYQDIEKSKIYSEIKKCFETDELRTFTNEFIFEDGKITYWKLELQRISQGVIIFSRDISDTQIATIQLKDTNSKLESLVERKTQDLLRTNKRLKNMTSYVAHDLRNPIANVISFAQLAKEFKDDISLFDHIISSGNECLEIITTLLEEGAILDGRITLSIERIDLSEFINSILESDTVINKSYIQMDLTPGIIIKIDKKRMKQVFKNLFINANKYSIDESPILITLNKDGLLSIRNEIDHKKISSAMKSSNINASTGYGLEITNSILTLHELKLLVEQSDNQYTVSIDYTPVISKRKRHHKNPH